MHYIIPSPLLLWWRLCYNSIIMEKSNTPEPAEYWDSEARKLRKMGAITLAGAAALALFGRSTSALKVGLVGSGMLAVSEWERRVSHRLES